VSRRRNKTQPAVTCFWNKIEAGRFTNRADVPEHPSRCRSTRDRIAAEAVSAPSIAARETCEEFRGKCWVGVVMGILHKLDGAPGRTRTSTDVNPPDFESGASTNSATGAPAGARPGDQHSTAARIIANSAPTASHWAYRPVTYKPFGLLLARGRKFTPRRARITRIHRKYKTSVANICLYCNNRLVIMITN
jgi:hypothetical protein